MVNVGSGVINIERPCYATRQEVARALDVKATAYDSARVDRACNAGSDSVDGQLQRVFYYMLDTRFWDWPNYQYTYPWKLYLDRSELADVTNNVPVVNSGGVLISNADIFWGDPNYPGPPYTYMELNRSTSAVFGNGPTPQREVSIQGTYGYWTKTVPAGTLGQNVGASDSAVYVSTSATPGVGDVMIVDNENMLVVDASYIDTGLTVSSGGTTAQASDNTLGVSSGTDFTIGEVIMIDSEWMRILAIYGNNLIVKRAVEGSVLATHSASAAIWAARYLSVLRGQLGTTTATHTSGTAITVQRSPGLVKQLAVAESIVDLVGETAAYAYVTGNLSSGTGMGGSGRTRTREPNPGGGLPDLRERTMQAYGRQARSRVV